MSCPILNQISFFFSFFFFLNCSVYAVIVHLPVLLCGGEATFYEDVTLVEFTFVFLHVSTSSWAVQVSVLLCSLSH